jgi:glycosyltransferase involved in cell wall biosynthesis
MDKSFWIINEYAGSPQYGMTYRHYYFARELIKKGYKVTIITASYSHFLTNFPRVSGKFTLENIDGINYIWVKVIKYSKAFSKKRVLKWFDFTTSLFFIPYKSIPAPDVILVSPTAPFPILPAWYWSKRLKSKLFFEVRDIWPLTIIELGNYKPSHPFIKFMGLFERFALKHSDEIISNLQNYGQHIKELGFNRSFTYIPNGISLEELENSESIDPDIKEIIPKNKFIVGYTGKFGISNALNILVAAAEQLKANPNIVFVLVGKGQFKDEIIKSCFHLDNIMFFDPVPKNQIQSLLKCFDVCYIGLREKKLFYYGVSPFKLFDYMYAGKPIIHAINTKNDLVSLAKCGLTVEAENPVALAKGIIELYQMTPQERYILGQNGKEYVLKYHNYQILTEKLLSLIDSVE